MSTVGTGWEPGLYEGAMIVKAVTEPSKVKSTPGLKITVDLAGHQIDMNPFWLSDAAIDRSLDEMNRLGLGFNLDFENPQFSNPGPHKIELRFEEFPANSGKFNPKWYFPQPAPAAIPKDRIAQLNARAKHAANIPRPSGAPPAPPRPAGGAPTPPKPPAAPFTPTSQPPAPPAAPPAPPAPPTEQTGEKAPPPPCTREAAWNRAWQASSQDQAQQIKLWNEGVANVCKTTGKPESAFTDAEWGLVAAEVMPF